MSATNTPEQTAAEKAAIGLQQAIADSTRVMVKAHAVLAAEKTTEKPSAPKRGLGRGLDALFADGEQGREARSEKRESEIVNAAVVKQEAGSHALPLASQSPRTLPITALIPTPFQPRKTFGAEDMESLVQSIHMHGILQPLLVRAAPGQPDKYEIIAGERRWRAAQQARLHNVPVIIKTLDDRQALELALIENIQRADLTPIEEAEGYQRLIEEFGHTQDALAKVVGKSRSHMTNTLRLLQLPAGVREMVGRGELSAGHARALVGRADAQEVADMAARKKWSVRDMEKFTRKQKQPVDFARMSIQELNARRHAKNDKDNPFGPFPGIDHAMPKSPDVAALEDEMSSLLGLRVEIHSMADASGVLGVHFSSLDQLDDLLQKLTRASRG